MTGPGRRGIAKFRARAVAMRPPLATAQGCGAPLAYALGLGLVVVRKIGKLPPQTLRESYSLEYGTSALEIRADAVARGERVLVMDDLLATGGTAEAAGKLVRRQHGVVVGYSFLVELASLNGASRLVPDNVHALIRYS